MKSNAKSHRNWSRVAKLAAGGIAATVFDLLVLVTLVEVFALAPGPAAFVSAMAGAGIGFSLSKYWAFSDSSPLCSRELGRFVGVALISAIAVASLVHVLASAAALPYLVAKTLAAVLVFALWSYPAQSRVVFKRAPQESAQ